MDLFHMLKLIYTEIDICWNLDCDQITYLFCNLFLQIWIWKRKTFLLAIYVSDLYEYSLEIRLEQSSLIWIFFSKNSTCWNTWSLFLIFFFSSSLVFVVAKYYYQMLESSKEEASNSFRHGTPWDAHPKKRRV